MTFLAPITVRPETASAAWSKLSWTSSLGRAGCGCGAGAIGAGCGTTAGCGCGFATTVAGATTFAGCAAGDVTTAGVTVGCEVLFKPKRKKRIPPTITTPTNAFA